jgi:hypothetical protein
MHTNGRKEKESAILRAGGYSTMFSPDVVNAIPFFSHGEGYIDERINSFLFDQQGMKRMRDWCDHLSKNVMDLLAQRGLGGT